MTHGDLVILAARWLRSRHRCCVVLTEWKGGPHHEIPDVIGWQGNGWSVLVEVKTSRSDFRADAKKVSRCWAGVGQERWFFAPRNVCPLGELPDGWGLCEFHREPVVVHTPPESHLLSFAARGDTVSTEDRGVRAQQEVHMLVSALRRLSENRGVATLCASMKDGASDISALKTLQDVKLAI